MSLINDALKKAQRERTTAPEHPATVTPTAPQPPSSRGPARREELRSRSNHWPLILVVLALIGGGTAVWFLKPGGQPMPATNTAAADRVLATSPAPATAAPAEPTPAPAPLQINLPAPATEPPTPAVSASVPPAAATPTVVQPAPQPPASPTTEPLKISLQLEDPRILAFLDAARIQGIRSVADDAKLLMNSKVFRPGSVVDRELGLKLVQILPTELVFEDPRGIQYRKVL